MATIAVASLMTSGGGGFAIAMFLASYVDSAYIMPSLFPPDPTEGAKIGEVGVMGADTGTPAPKCYGTFAKVAGQLLWTANFTEISNSERQGKNGRKVTYRYYVDVAVGICRTDATPLASLDSVLADEKVVYANQDTVNPTPASGTGVGLLVEGGKQYMIFDPVVNSSVLTDFYHAFEVGDKVQLSGFATLFAGNWTILEKLSLTLHYGVAQGMHAEKDYFAFRMPYWGETDHEWRTEALWYVDYWWEETNEFRDTLVPAGKSTSVTLTGVQGAGWQSGIQQSGDPVIHLGNNTTADSILTTVEDDVPAFKDLAYIAFDQLNLDDFGMRIPNFEFIVSNTARADAQACLDDILQDSGLDSTEYDVSEVNEDAIIGFSTLGATATVKKIQPLALAFSIMAQERGGKLHFFTHNSSVTLTEIEDDYVGAYTNKPTGGISVQQSPIDERHGEVAVTYVNAMEGARFSQGLERAMAYSHANEANRETSHRWTKLSVNLGLTLEPNDAREIAHRLLWSQWADDLMFEFTLPARYLKLQENDRISINVNGTTHKAVVRKIDVGANYMMKIEAKLDVAVDQDFSGWGY